MPQYRLIPANLRSLGWQDLLRISVYVAVGDLYIPNDSLLSSPEIVMPIPTAARLLGSWVRIPLRAWMFVFCVYMVSCVGRGLCDGPITHPGESYHVSNPVGLRNIKRRRPTPDLSCRAIVWMIIVISRQFGLFTMSNNRNTCNLYPLNHGYATYLPGGP
jgi:hypothetical protein